MPTNRPPTVSTTTHPDQQDGIWIPDGTGGVTLAVGNDGSFYRQHQAAAGEFDNGGWGNGNDTGMNTLLPYGIAAANDGTVWAGLHDNGHLKIAPDGKEYETYGGDGTWAGGRPEEQRHRLRGLRLQRDEGDNRRRQVVGGDRSEGDQRAVREPVWGRRDEVRPRHGRSVRQRQSDGWHIATAAGLPNRYITSIAIDPANKQTIYVTVGGYSRRWVPPGTLQDTNQNVGVGHIFRSTGGETFTDVSGNLPDVPATWATLRGTQVIVGMDTGVYASAPTGGTTYAVLNGLPVVPISSLTLKPNDCNTLFAATYGRSVWKYQFASSIASCVSGGGGGTPATPPPGATGTSLAGLYGWELGDEGWTTSSTSAATGWKRASPGATSSTSFQVFPYTDESTYTLTSPGIANPGGWVYVNFQRKQDTEPGFDYLNLEWSTDGGANWNAAPWIWDGGTQTWRNDLAFTGQNASFPAFVPEKAAFQAPAGGSLQIRFGLDGRDGKAAPPLRGIASDAAARPLSFYARPVPPTDMSTGVPVPGARQTSL